MRKKLYFRQNIKLGPISFYILIDHAKIREFRGIKIISYMVMGGPAEYKTFKLNSTFEIVKLTKYDQKEIVTTANYKIISQELESIVGQETFIKLNHLDYFRILYTKKEDVFHKMNLTQKILTLILITIPSAILIAWISGIFHCDCQKESNKSENQPIQKVRMDSTNSIKTK